MPADLSVREDGAARVVTKIAPPAAPLQIALLVDDTSAIQPLLPELRAALSAFVRTVLTSRPDTQVAWWTFGEQSRMVFAPTNDAAALQRAIDGLYARTGDGSYFMEAVLDAARDLRRREAARPAIVAFLLDDAPERSTSPERAITAAVRDAGAMLWTIVQHGRVEPGTPAPAERRDRTTVTTDNAIDSGGGTKDIVDRLEMDEAFASVAAALTAQLEVTYERPAGAKPPSKLQVTTKRSDVKILAPKWAPR